MVIILASISLTPLLWEAVNTMKKYKYIIHLQDSEIDTGEFEAENIDEARELIREQIDFGLDILPISDYE